MSRVLIVVIIKSICNVIHIQNNHMHHLSLPHIIETFQPQILFLAQCNRPPRYTPYAIVAIKAPMFNKLDRPCNLPNLLLSSVIF